MQVGDLPEPSLPSNFLRAIHEIDQKAPCFLSALADRRCARLGCAQKFLDGWNHRRALLFLHKMPGLGVGDDGRLLEQCLPTC
jgi:hypothetical protein